MTAHIRQMICSLDTVALEALASRGLLRRAKKDLERHPAITISEDGGLLRARYESRDIVIPNAGPSQATCSCPAPGYCHHILVVLLHVQADGMGDPAMSISPGQHAEPDPNQWIDAAAEGPSPPRPRKGGRRASGSAEIQHPCIEACRRLLNDSFAVGLAHLARSHAERFQTLAISVKADLPRPGRLLQSIAHDTKLLVDRDARSDTSRLFDRAAELHALLTVIEGGPYRLASDLVGSHRTTYEDVGSLDLMGVAAYPWRTASGYEGLTVLFRDMQNHLWNTWSESRPVSQAGTFSAVGRYRSPGPWEGADSPEHLAQNRFRLRHARRNLEHRLSSSTRTLALRTGTADILDAGVPILERWEPLRQELQARSPLSLQPDRLLDVVAVIRPRGWERRWFDPIQQTFSWIVTDAADAPLTIEIPFDELSAPGIRYLESLSPEELEGCAVVGRLQHGGDRLRLWPFALHPPGKQMVALYLGAGPAGTSQTESDMRPRPTGRTEGAEVGEEQPEGGDEDDPGEQKPSLTGPSTRLRQLIDDVLFQLLVAAETGLLQSLDTLPLEALASLCERSALGLMASSLRELVACPATPALLQASHIARLHLRGLSRV